MLEFSRSDFNTNLLNKYVFLCDFTSSFFIHHMTSLSIEWMPSIRFPYLIDKHSRKKMCRAFSWISRIGLHRPHTRVLLIFSPVFTWNSKWKYSWKTCFYSYIFLVRFLPRRYFTVWEAYSFFSVVHLVWCLQIGDDITEMRLNMLKYVVHIWCLGIRILDLLLRSWQR